MSLNELRLKTEDELLSPAARGVAEARLERGMATLIASVLEDHQRGKLTTFKAANLIIRLFSDDVMVPMPRKPTQNITEAMERWKYVRPSATHVRGHNMNEEMYRLAIEAVHGKSA